MPGRCAPCRRPGAAGAPRRRPCRAAGRPAAAVGAAPSRAASRCTRPGPSGSTGRAARRRRPPGLRRRFVSALACARCARAAGPRLPRAAPGARRPAPPRELAQTQLGLQPGPALSGRRASPGPGENHAVPKVSVALSPLFPSEGAAPAGGHPSWAVGDARPGGVVCKRERVPSLRPRGSWGAPDKTLTVTALGSWTASRGKCALWCYYGNSGRLHPRSPMRCSRHFLNSSFSGQLFLEHLLGD